MDLYNELEFKDDPVFKSPVSNVSSSIDKLIKAHLSKILLFIFGSLAWAGVCFYLWNESFANPNSLLGRLGGSDYTSSSIVVVALWPIILLALKYYSAVSRLHFKFMKEFAKANNYSFAAQIPPSTEGGILFSFSKTKYILNVITGKVHDRPIRIFNYSIDTKRMFLPRLRELTIFDFEGANDLPQMFLDSKRSKLAGALKSPIKLSDSRLLQLEGDFQRYFELYVPEKYETEALQVFTPEIMAYLIDTAQKYDIEIYKRKISVIYDGTIQDTESMKDLYNVAQGLNNKLRKRLERLRYSRIGDADPTLRNQALRSGSSPIR